MAVKIVETNVSAPEARALMAELDRELSQHYPASSIHGIGHENFHNDGGVFLVAFSGSRPVGCGGLRRIDGVTGELKRLFVVPEMRRRGISRAILAQLESMAREWGLRELFLETGDRQPEAQAVFQSAGYSEIAPFGEYSEDPHSVCFRREL